MGRHAYLIMAHNQFDLLEKLITELDDELNDLYVHIDSKAGEIDEQIFRCRVRKSNIYFINRMPIVWAGESQIKCEMELFKAAYEQHYQYYHLISGVDFPIKTQKELHTFFDRNEGKEFIEIWQRPEKEYLFRVKYYYPLQEQIGRYTYDLKTLILRVGSKILIGAQKFRGVDRLKRFDGEFKLGANWVSITDSLVSYLINNEKRIYDIFGCGVATDEMFVQTMAWNSRFQNSIYFKGALRLIDWDRGKPYTWQEKDIEEIMSSECFFVRKVCNENGLVDLITERLQGSKEENE